MTHIPGKITFIVDGKDILELGSDGLIKVRGREIIQDKEAYEAFKDWLDKAHKNCMWTSTDPYNEPQAEILARDKDGYHGVYVRMWFGSGKDMHKKGFTIKFKEDDLSTIPEGVVAPEYFLSKGDKTRSRKNDRDK